MQRLALGGDVVREGVDAPSACALALEVVQAVEEAAVDEGHGFQFGQEAVGGLEQVLVTVLGEVPVGLVAALAERSLFDLRIQGGEKEILQHGAVVVRGVRRVMLEGCGGERLGEDVLRHQAFFLEEPDEQQARDQPDHMPFQAAGAGAVVREFALRNRALVPSEQLPVEAAVELLGIQRVLPRPVQVVEVGDACVLDQAGERQVRQDVEMGAVRRLRVHVLHQRHSRQYVAVAVATVSATMDHRETAPLAVAKKEHNRYREQAVHRPRHLGEGRPTVDARRQVNGDEYEGFDTLRIERFVNEQAADAAHLLVSHLEHQLHVLPSVEQAQLPLGQLALGVSNRKKLRRGSRFVRDVALIAERVEQRTGAFEQRRIGEAQQRVRQRLLHLVNAVAHLH